MMGEGGKFRGLFSGLSARLLLFTIFFVMLSEVLIYAPSIARFRQVYLQERIAYAHLASLALEVPPDAMVSPKLRKELLDHAGSYGIVLRRPASKALMLSNDMPPKVDLTVDLRETSFMMLLGEAFMTLAGDGSRYMRLIDFSPKDPAVTVETVISEAPLRMAMLDFSWRILALSIVISLITASLVFLALQWLFVRPLRGLTRSMVFFREAPEDGRRVIRPGRRTDELGLAERELADMQEGLRGALRQRARLAALGTAVAKINHDLRNILATAQLVSDRLAASRDPEVKRVAPTLLGAIDRAVALCTRTLRFVQEGTPPLELSWIDLGELVGEIADAVVVGLQDRAVMLENRVESGFRLHVDRDQLFRVLFNLVRNAYEAGASRVTVSASMEDGPARIEVADNGPGLPARLRQHLFEPFVETGRADGTGLGLSIARDLVQGHGGDIALAATGEDGTTFRLILPVDAAAERGAPPPQPAANAS
ncbi:MAG: sensor histidine kinase [Alphaproteobacteria bacterium]|nr:sensor histidine kinase [Alphaproteobacteria bacterium]